MNFEEKILNNFKKKDSSKNVSGKRILRVPDSAKFFKAQVGRNKIFIVPYTVGDQHPTLKLWDMDYVLDIWVHRFVGAVGDSFICPTKNYGKPCPICEEVEKLKEDWDKNKPEIKSLSAKRRCYYNIVDTNELEKEVQIFEVSFHFFEKEILEEAVIENGEEFTVVSFADIENGKYIKFRATEEEYNKNKFLKYKSFDFEDRDALTDEILKQAYALDSLLVLSTYDEIKESFHGVVNNSDNVIDTTVVNTKVENNNDCSHGHSFGHDCDTKPECVECESWDKCADKKDEL